MSTTLNKERGVESERKKVSKGATIPLHLPAPFIEEVFIIFLGRGLYLQKCL
jgi:hypothetical protein